ncbi:hypothetical protein CRYUN_Cryun33cG0054800 [Craigia yunnanensis]
MNRGVLQSSPVQQLMTGNPNWCSINSMRPPTHQQAASPFFPPTPTFFSQFTPTSSSSSSSTSLPISSWHDNQELPESWSQLLLGGVVGEEEKGGIGQFQVQPKKLENWVEEQALHQASSANSVVDVKQEYSASSYVYGHANEDFHHQCNSTATGGALKKARVQPSATATQSTFKVRKETLGDRITALHQLVSPFGKTDTASVLLEAIGYIRFLQSQIEALSLPYMDSGSGNMRQQQSVQRERNCIFPEDPGQLLNENCMKRKGGPDQQDSHDQETKKDLRSRGLCLVPVSCTLQVGSDNGADYWAPALGCGFR